MVGGALRLWNGVGLVLRGAEGHPLPDPTQEAMPNNADSRVLFWSQDAPSWECHGVAHAHARACCGVHRNPHAATHCTDPICQLPRPDIPQVGSFELRDMLPWRQRRL
jgi:hypothetical protein